ncbi:MAG: hypothetical protein WC788_00895 [Candidatus Paceibacterota bacterium]
MSMSQFDLYFYVSGIVGIVSMMALLLNIGKNRIKPHTTLVGLLICTTLSGVAIITTMGVFSYGSNFDPMMIVVSVSIISMLAIANIQQIAEIAGRNSLGVPAPLKDGIFIAESNSERFNGISRVWLRKPPNDKGTERVYEIPKNTLVLSGQTVEVKNGEILII